MLSPIRVLIAVTLLCLLVVSLGSLGNAKADTTLEALSALGVAASLLGLIGWCSLLFGGRSQPTLKEIHDAAVYYNRPSDIPGGPFPLTTDFLAFLRKHRPGADDVIVRWMAANAAEPMQIIPWDGDWLLYFPGLTLRNVPENCIRWFWFPDGRTYMYLRSHPSKLHG
jgi:hypothetical protein